MYRLKAMLKFFKVSILATTICLLLSACGEKKSIAEKSIDTLFDMNISGVPFKAQVAVSDTEKMRGLMFRESLPENCGMIFVYQTPMRASFWMKNTLIPLDIGFFDKNGTLTEIRKLYPQNLDSVTSVRSDISYCIEMNAGWFEKNNIKSSAKLDMKMLKNAIKMRMSK